MTDNARVIAREPGLLIARANATSIRVIRLVLSRDEDQSWLDVLAYAEKHAMKPLIHKDLLTNWGEPARVVYFFDQVWGEFFNQNLALLKQHILGMSVEEMAEDFKAVLSMSVDASYLLTETAWVELASEDGKFYAHAADDDSQVVVVHGRLLDDEDPIWAGVWEFITRHNMELADRCEGEHPLFNMGAVSRWFMTPAQRKLLRPDSVETFRRGVFGPPADQ